MQGCLSRRVVIGSVTRVRKRWEAMILSGTEIKHGISPSIARQRRAALVGERSAETEYFLKSYSNHFKQKLRPFFSVRSEKFARKLPP